MNDLKKTEPEFYVVSMGKFTLLYFATLGLYSAAWFFMHWMAQLKATEGPVPPERQLTATILRASSAALRSLFAIFFVLSLFGRLRNREKALDMHYPWQPNFLAVFFIGLQLVSVSLSVLVEQPKQSVGWVLISFGMMLMEYYVLYKVQLVANRVEKDPFGRANSVINFMNAGFLGVGAMFWFAMIKQLFTGQ